MATQQQRSENTRRIIVDVFRTTLLAEGLDAATVQRVLDDTGLSKGALYHHFKSKHEIIEAIYLAEASAAIDAAHKAADPHLPPLDRLKCSAAAWMDSVAQRDIGRILFDIGPTALGMQKAKELEDGLSLHHFRALLTEAVDTGDAVISDVPLAAKIISAGIGEAAIHRLKTGRDSGDMVNRLIDALCASPRTPRKHEGD